MQQEHEEQRAKAERLNPSVGDDVVFSRSSVTSKALPWFSLFFLANIFSSISTENGHSWPFHNDIGHYKGIHAHDAYLEQKFWTFWHMNSTKTRNDIEQQKPRTINQLNQ